MLKPRVLHFVLLLATALAACAGSQRERDQTSAAGHRAEARLDDSAARREKQQYDPRAVEYRPTGGRTPSEVELPDTQFNPTRGHLDEANADTRHARAHRAAASRLESFEDQECRGIAAATRAACPLLGPVARVTDLRKGVRFEYRTGTDLGPIAGLMRCHLAYARAVGFDSGGGCPLYLPGVQIQTSQDGRSIDLTADEDTTIAELRHAGRQIAR